MQRKFLTSLILVVVLNLLVKPFYIFGIDAEVQNRVGEEIYGNYFSLFNFSLLLNILLDLGTTNFNTRNIAQHPQLLAKHFFKILSLRLSLFALYATFTLLSGLFLEYDSYEFYLLALLMVNQFLIAIIQFCRSNFAGLHLFKTDAFISVLDRGLLIVLCSVLLWGNVTDQTFQIEWFIYAQTVAYGTAALFSLIFLSGKIGQIKLKIKKTFSLAILKASFPYSLFIFLMFMYTRVDVVMVERLLDNGDNEAGIYAQGYRILDAVNVFALLFTGILFPIFARLIKEKKEIASMLSLGARLILVMSLSVACIGYLYKDYILDLRYLEVQERGIITFGILILSFVPITITHVFGTLLTANGSLKQLNRLGIATVLLNVILNLILIPTYGIVGAATATIITQSLMAIAQILLVNHLFKRPLKFTLLIQFIAFTVILSAGIYAWMQTETEVGILLQIFIWLIIAVVIAIATRLLRLSDFKNLAGAGN